MFFWGEGGNLLRKPSVLVAQLWCPTLCNTMSHSPPGSSVPGILQARILEWVAIPFSRGSSQPWDQTQVYCTAGGFFTVWASREAQRMLEWVALPFSRGSSQPRGRTWVSCLAGGFLVTVWASREAPEGAQAFLCHRLYLLFSGLLVLCPLLWQRAGYSPLCEIENRPGVLMGPSPSVSARSTLFPHFTSGVRVCLLAYVTDLSFLMLLLLYSTSMWCLNT